LHDNIFCSPSKKEFSYGTFFDGTECNSILECFGTNKLEDNLYVYALWPNTFNEKQFKIRFSFYINETENSFIKEFKVVKEWHPAVH
jgi:hypothetical protein